MRDAAGAGAKELLSFARVVNDGERLQVSGVGGAGDFGITIKAGDALGHREPGDDSFALAIAMTASEKAIRMIDDGFDAKDDAELGIHFDPVFTDAVFNAHAFGSGLEIGNNFRGEIMSQLFPEECQEVSGAKTEESMFDEFAEQRSESGGIFEHDISGEFGLIGSPVIRLAGEDVWQKWIDKGSEFLQEDRPVKAGELICQALALFRAGDFDKGIIDLLEGYIPAAHLDGEPFVAIDGDLKNEGEPGLDADMDETEFGMEEIIIDTKALAIRGKDTRSADAIADFEGRAGFQFGKDTDQAAGNVHFSRDAACFIVLADVAREVLVKTVMFGGRIFGMKDKAIRLSLDELAEILDFQSAAGYKLIQACGIADGFEMAFENDAVKTVERAGNLIGNFVGKRFHGVLSW